MCGVGLRLEELGYINVILVLPCVNNTRVLTSLVVIRYRIQYVVIKLVLNVAILEAGGSGGEGRLVEPIVVL